MRLAGRAISYSVILGALVMLVAGCSGRGISSPTLSTQSVTVKPAALLRTPLSLDAFPSSIDAFPSSIGAFPSSLSAFPTCNVPATHGQAMCHSQYRSDIAVNGNPATPVTSIQGYHPADLQDAYGLTAAAATAGSDQNVAIVVAYHNPNLSSDLNVYRATFGLPTCLSANAPPAPGGGLLGGLLGGPPAPSAGPPAPGGGPGAAPAAGPGAIKNCLNVVWQAGGNKWSGKGKGPSYDPNWGTEEVLDAEMVSAVCPNCSITVYESRDAQISNLASAAEAAADNGATEVSNSYTLPETPDLAQYAQDYVAPGVPMTASAGDQGYGPGFPATLPTVTAVGGASLVHAAMGWGEAVWPGTGSGCSGFAAKPSWQTDTGCKNRTVNDLAVDADPATGVAAYVSAVGGWAVFGGTSIGAPMVAGMYALAENGSNINDASSLYANANSFAPVAARANGTCYPNYLCTGGPGYDGPSGLGMPYGLSAF
jgi:subtilase family serine protease